jgi:hypothetical protein
MRPVLLRLYTPKGKCLIDTMLAGERGYVTAKLDHKYCGMYLRPRRAPAA